MFTIARICVCLSIVVLVTDAARILAVVPTPSISHQVVFRPLTQELAKRGHDVTVITTDPVFPKGHAPINLTEIDLHEISYTAWNNEIFSSEFLSGSKDDIYQQVKIFFSVISKILEIQMHQPQVKKIISNETQFDLLLLESWVRPVLLYTHVFKNVPVILVSSFNGVGANYDTVGAPARPPVLYPTLFRQKTINLSLKDKITELYNHYVYESIFHYQDQQDDKMIKRILGPEAPTNKELQKNVDMLFLNVYPLWNVNRPVPPSVVYIGGIHQIPENELPKDIKDYLDSSKHGVIYISYGTNVSPSQLPPEKIQMLVRALSKLPYDVLWKWDKDELPNKSQNIRISKWLPQSDLLKHPKVKVFVTQGGLQSTDEAITAGVPLIGMPMIGDQWYNVEQYVLHKIGIRVDLETLSEEKFLEAVKTVINDDSYRKNMERLRAIMHDQPQPALDRAVWWAEHLIRHGSGRHLRAPAANMTWAEYLDVELMAVIGLLLLSVIAVVGVALWVVVRTLKKVFRCKKIKKS